MTSRAENDRLSEAGKVKCVLGVTFKLLISGVVSVMPVLPATSKIPEKYLSKKIFLQKINNKKPTLVDWLTVLCLALAADSRGCSGLEDSCR